jgi:hypothetical protein
MHDGVSVVPRPSHSISRRVSLSAGRIDGAVFCLLLGLGITIYWPIFGIRPLDGDNFYILWWAHNAPFQSLLRLDPQIYPEWRPLTYQSIWLEHRLVPLTAVAAHHAINLLILVSCAWLCYRIVVLLSASRIVGAVMAAWLIVDQRSALALVLIVERQTTLACLFGLFAMLMFVRADDRRLTGSESGLVAILLLASALSKEYGLCFPLALMVYAGWRQRRDLAWPAVIGVVLYATLRLALVGGATGLYCEDMGFFFRTERHCIDPVSARSLTQMTYNVAASAIGIPLQGIINDEGMIGLSRIRLATTAAFLVLALTGLAKGPRETRLFVLISLFNAALGFVVYRDRNLIPGTSAMAILTGVGLALRQPRLSNIRMARAARVAALTIVIVAVGWQARETRRLVVEQVSKLLTEDPCASDVINRPGGLEFAKLVKTTYGLANPTCLKTE